MLKEEEQLQTLIGTSKIEGAMVSLEEIFRIYQGSKAAKTCRYEIRIAFDDLQDQLTKLRN